MNTRITLLIPCLATGLVLSGQCLVDIPQDTVTVFHGYEPLACATVEALVEEAVEPYTMEWSSGVSGTQITVCDTIPGWYFVNLQDAEGCSYIDSVFVNVADVRCGANNHKVLVCHLPPGNPANMKQICIGAPAVAAHLAHGCLLGPCAVVTDSVQTDGLQLTIAPNPMSKVASVNFSSTTDERVSLSVIDASGRMLSVLYEGDLAAGDPRTLYLDEAELPASTHLVWLRLQGLSGVMVHRALVIGR
ncbi:MAG: hypothetical protein KIT10_02620 [Flavobacteriales bacterium]|nr:hypothetical protein [Flavobacteriales bacterium]